MAFPLAAIDPLSRSFRGTAGLIAQTAQFQLETGKSEALTLAENCWWPSIPVAARGDGETQQFLTAPLCIVTHDPGQAFNLPFQKLADGEVFVQLALLADAVTYPDQRDQFTDILRRVYKIQKQALDTAGLRNAETQWNTVNNFAISQPPELNNLGEVQFVDGAGDPVRVWQIPLIASWRAD